MYMWFSVLYIEVNFCCGILARKEKTNIKHFAWVTLELYLTLAVMSLALKS